MSRCSTRPRTRQRAALIARPDHASKRARLCHSHVHASALVNASVDRARVGGSRFLQVDPIEGGSANDYDYVYGDPINQLDLDGRCAWCSAIADTVTNPIETFKTGYRGMSPTGQALVETTLKVAPEGIAMLAGVGAVARAGRVGWTVAPRVYRNAKGVGLTFSKNGKQMLRFDWHRFTYKGRTVNRPHINYRTKNHGIGRHWPWT